MSLGKALGWNATKLIDRVKTSKWVGDCFIYTNATNRLSYLIGDQAHVLNHFDQ